MSGVILGAMHGYEVIRTEDIEQLNKVNRLDLCGIADRFSEIAAGIIEEDLRIYESRKRVWMDELL